MHGRGFFTYSSKTFPIAVHCRSLAEAQAVWKLQPMIRKVEKEKDPDRIVHLILSDPSLCSFMGESVPNEVEFYAVLFNKENRPTVCLSW